MFRALKARALRFTPASFALYHTKPEQSRLAGRSDYSQVLITDVTHAILKGEIAHKVGKAYHQLATKEEAENITKIGECLLFGSQKRTIFPTVVKYSGSNVALWVFFIVDSGSPISFLSAETFKSLGIPSAGGGEATVDIGGRTSDVGESPPGTHIAELNILGMDFFEKHDMSQWNHWKRKQATLYFLSERWKVVGRDKD